MIHASHAALLRYILEAQPYTHDSGKVERFFKVCAMDETILMDSTELARLIKYYFASDAENILHLYWRYVGDVQRVQPLVLSSPSALCSVYGLN